MLHRVRPVSVPHLEPECAALTPFIFIAQEKDPPYVAELFVLDQAFINLGRHENRRGLDVIATGLSTGDWPPRTGRGPAVLCPPSWARKMQ